MLQNCLFGFYSPPEWPGIFLKFQDWSSMFGNGLECCKFVCLTSTIVCQNGQEYSWIFRIELECFGMILNAAKKCIISGHKWSNLCQEKKKCSKVLSLCLISIPSERSGIFLKFQDGSWMFGNYFECCEFTCLISTVVQKYQEYSWYYSIDI